MSASEPEPAQENSATDSASPDGAPRRRQPVGPVVLLILAAAALWAASRMTWVTIVSSDGLTTPRTHHLDGGVWFGALTPVALVLLAAVAAVFATRGWLRRLVGVVIALLAAVAAVPGLALLTHHGQVGARAAVLAELPVRARVDVVSVAAFPATVTVLGAILAFAAGVLLARMPESTARMSGKYDNPVFRRASAAEQVARQRAARIDSVSGDSDPASDKSAASSTEEGAARGSSPAKPVVSQTGSAPTQPLSERVLWDALDAGADPTDDEAERDR